MKTKNIIFYNILTFTSLLLFYLTYDYIQEGKVIDEMNHEDFNKFEALRSVNELLKKDTIELPKLWAEVETQYNDRDSTINMIVSTVQHAADFDRVALSKVIDAKDSYDVGKLTSKNLMYFQLRQIELRVSVNNLFASFKKYPNSISKEDMLFIQKKLEASEQNISFKEDEFYTHIDLNPVDKGPSLFERRRTMLHFIIFCFIALIYCTCIIA